MHEAATQTSPKQLICARIPQGQKNRTLGLDVDLKVAMRKRHSPHKTEGDTEVILADTVIATIFLKRKLQKKQIIKWNERK